jgi:hypothetical protein
MVRVLGAEDYRPLVVSTIPDSMNWAWVRRPIREIIDSIRRRELRVWFIGEVPFPATR